MPPRTFLVKQDESAERQKPAKDRLILLLGGNVGGDIQA
jgi:hypothetical protein